MTECRVPAPAYCLNHSDQVQRVQRHADQLRNDWKIGVTLAEHACHIGQRGSWPPLPQRQQDWAWACEATYVWTVRGGYGCLELLAAEASLPQVLIGYSDVTALHAAMHQAGRPGLYAANADSVITDAGWIALIDALRGQTISLASDTHAAPQVIRTGAASGPSFVGCLRILAALAGTQWQPKLHGHILFIEDIDERPYSSDRDLWQCYHSGMLDGVVGVVSSSFVHESAPDYGGPTHPELFTGWAQRLNVPWIHGLRFGHDPNPLPIGIGWPTKLSANSDSWQITQNAPSTWPQLPN